MNRDHWTRPYQGNGRNHHDYGNSGPIGNKSSLWHDAWIAGALVLGAICLMVAL